MSGDYTEVVAETTDDDDNQLQLLRRTTGDSGYHCLRGRGYLGLETEIQGFTGAKVEDNSIGFYRLIPSEGQYVGRVTRDPRVVELLVEGGLVEGESVMDLQEVE